MARTSDAVVKYTLWHAVTIEDQDDDTRLHPGPAWSAALLEVVMIVRDDGSEIAIHAMGMEPITDGCYREAEHGEENA